MFSLTMIARLLLAGVVVAVLAAPARAQTPTPVPTPTPAPSIAPLDRCYVSASPTDTEPIQISASNFDPLAVIDVYIDDVLQPVPKGAAQPQADAAGALVGSTPAPYQVTGQRSFVLRLAQHNGGNSQPMARSKVTALEVSSSPADASTSSVVRFRGRGFTDLLHPIYAHYVLGGKAYATVRIGKPRFDCGQFSVRRKQFPFKNPRTGVWTIQFDQLQAYDPQPPLFTTLRVHVHRKGKTKG